MAEINLDDLPEQFRNLFVERDGRYTIDDSRLGDFQKNADDVRRALSARDNEKRNVEELRKQLQALQDQMGGIDPSQLSQALEAQKRIEELEHQQLISEKKFEEAAEKKYTRQIAEMQRQIESLNSAVKERETQYTTAMSDLEDARITTQLTAALTEAGVNPKMVPYIIATERKNWELDPETRQPIPIEYVDNGRSKVTAMGPDGKPLTFKTHATTFLQNNPDFALPSNGSNAVHQNNRQGNGTSITIRRDEARQDPRRYEAARAEAEAKNLPLQFVE